MRSEKEARVLKAATAVFLRYGYRRTTMGDLATAAGISRPALYLLFCNKERIFQAVCLKVMVDVLDQIRQAVAQEPSPVERLNLAFELWAVRPFGLMMESPDARDLLDCGFDFAREEMDQGYAAFEAQLTTILEDIPRSMANAQASSAEMAHILTTAIRGFKVAARNCQELQSMIRGLLKMTLAALGQECERPLESVK